MTEIVVSREDESTEEDKPRVGPASYERLTTSVWAYESGYSQGTVLISSQFGPEWKTPLLRLVEQLFASE